jgi:putative tricarboxylic transport membrane protein
VKLLMIPYKYLYPSALFFVCIGVYSANNDMFQVGEVLVIGVAGYLLNMLGFHPAPILLGFVLGPRVEENFRRAMLISRGDLLTFVERPISAFFVGMAALLILAQIVVWLRGKKGAVGSFGVEIPLGAAALKPMETAPAASSPRAAE